MEVVGELTVEQKLIERAARGEWLNLAATDKALDTGAFDDVKDATMRSWGKSRTCDAGVIRDILLGKHGGDPCEVRLRGARIDGRLDLQKLAMDARLELADCFLEEGIVAQGGRLGSVILTGCLIEHPTDPADPTRSPLDGRGLTCSELVLDRARIIADTRADAVDLSSAHIGGPFSCRQTELRNRSGAALRADHIQVDQDMILSKFTAIGAGEDPTINLRDGHVGGTFMFAPSERGLVHKSDSRRRLAANGLIYAGVPEPMDASIWLDLLRNGTPGYSAQPYEQLAAAYWAVGAKELARRTRITQHDDELAREPMNRAARAWGHFTKFTVGYGYQPGRALWLLAAVVILSTALTGFLGSYGALAQTDMTAKDGKPCTVIQEISVGMDLGLPIGTSLAREDCDLPTNQGTTTAWLIGTEFVMRCVAWVLTALFAAAVTGALSKINL